MLLKYLNYGYTLRNTETGISLITLLFSMSLGFVLILGTIQWHQVLKRTFISQKMQRRFLSAGQSTFQLFMNDLKNSGYRGCRTLDASFPVRSIFVNTISPARYFRVNRKVFGFEVLPGNCYGKIPNKTCKKIKESSTVLIIYSVPQTIYSLTQDMSSPDEPLTIKENHKIRKGSMVLISDCLQGELFISDAVSLEKVFHRKTVQTNRSSYLNKTYPKGTEVVELKTLVYYLGKPARFPGNADIYSLYRDDLFHESEEVLEGIEDFQVKFGVLEDSGVIQYKESAMLQNNHWEKVQKIHIKIKMKQPLEAMNASEYKNGEWEYEFSI